MADDKSHPYARGNRGPHRGWRRDENLAPPNFTSSRLRARGRRNYEYKGGHGAKNAVDIENDAKIIGNIQSVGGQANDKVQNGQIPAQVLHDENYVGNNQNHNSEVRQAQFENSEAMQETLDDCDSSSWHGRDEGDYNSSSCSQASSMSIGQVSDNVQSTVDFDEENGGSSDLSDGDYYYPGTENLNNQWRPVHLPELDVPIFPPLTTTKYECLLMIMSFALRHGLAQVAIEDLCKLVNQIFGGMHLPTSEHLLNKIFGKSDYVYNFYCSNCVAYLTDFRSTDAISGSKACEVCNTICNFSNMNSGSFYITFSVEEQLRNVLENTDQVMEYLNHRWERPVENDVISDVYDGKAYRELSKEGNFLSSRHNLSITFNTDGASVFDATGNTLWPIHFSINEFPPSVRFNQVNTMLAGIWFGKCEPKMPLFLCSFVNNLQILADRGFSWRSPLGQTIRSKVILLNGVMDSKARPLVQGVKMHNGYYGCGHCHHPGVMYVGSNEAKYPMNSDATLMEDNGFCYTVVAPDPITKERRTLLVDDRSNDSIRKDAELVELERFEVGEGHIHGVKERSILWPLDHFDVAFGFTIDYMHAVLLGVVKHTTELWFDYTSIGHPYYIGFVDLKRKVDARLLNIKPPVSFSRCPRTLGERVHWEAKEWRSWLLYYSIPCLLGILPKTFLAHHCLLVSAIHILLRTRITKAMLEEACLYLAHYCIEFKNLYGVPHMNLNVHLLLHLGKCVDLYGPMFCFSSFSYENANESLIKLFKGSQGVLSQIANKYSKCKTMSYSVDLYNVSESCMDYCSKLLCHSSSEFSHKIGNLSVLADPILTPLSKEERKVIQASGHNVTSETFERVLKEGVIYHARCYKRKGLKSDSCHVQLNNSSCCVLERIIHSRHFRGSGDPKYLALVREMKVYTNRAIVTHERGAKATHIKRCSSIVYGKLKLVFVDDIHRQLIVMDCINKTFVAALPDNYED